VPTRYQLGIVFQARGPDGSEHPAGPAVDGRGLHVGAQRADRAQVVSRARTGTAPRRRLLHGLPGRGLGGADRDEQTAIDVEGQVLDVERDKRRTAEGASGPEAGVGGGALQLVVDARRRWRRVRAGRLGGGSVRLPASTPGVCRARASDTSPHYADSMSPERRPPDVDDGFLTVAEVAAILKLDQQTIRNWIDAGSLAALLRCGGRQRRLRFM
jgi:excisionase family DNA binding protein